MDATGSVTEKIQIYINSHPDYVGKPLSEISAELISLGVVTQEEISLLDSKSTFSILNQNSDELENEDVFSYSDDDVEDGTSNNLSVKTSVSANGDEIVEKRNGEELVEKIIKQKTENSEEVKTTTITYSKGKPVSKKVTNDSGDVLEDYSYTKVVLSSGEEAYSVVKLDGNGDNITQDVVSDIDENGGYKSEDFKSRIKVFLKDAVLPNGMTIKSGAKQVVQTYNGKIVESVVGKNDGKVINTLYNGNSITEYDEGNLNRLSQQIKNEDEVHTVNYDGKGNTRVVIRNNDGLESITKYFNREIDRRGLDASHHFTQADLEALNPKEAKHGLQVGQTILVPSEYNANAPILVNRGTQEQAVSAYTQVAQGQTIDRLYASTIDEQTLSRNYSSYEELARETLRKQGVANPTAAQLNDRANELIILNKRVPLKKGLKVKIVSGQSSATDVKALNSAGFKQTPENNLFYTKFNSLDANKKQQVLNVLKAYSNEKDINKLKAIVFETTGVNLYDTSLTINEHKQGSMEAGFDKSSIPLEYFITNRLGLDLNSKTGKETYLRLRSLPQEQLNNISASQFAPTRSNQFGMPNNKIAVGSDADFKAVVSAMASQGVELRTSSEIRVEESNPRVIAQRKKEEAISFLYHSAQTAYDIISAHLEELKSNMFSNLGEIMLEDIKHFAVPDALKKLINITGVKSGTVDGLVKSIFNKQDELSDMLFKINQLRTSSNFEKDYKALTGHDYNPDNPNPFGNESMVGDAQSFIQTSAFGGNILEMAAMIYFTAGMGEIGVIKNSGTAVEALTGSRALGMGARGALTLGTYTAGRETLNLIDDFRNADNLSDLGGALGERGLKVLEHSGQSALFGFVGGASAQKLSNLSKGAQNFVSNQFSKVFGKGGEVALSDGASATTQAFSPSAEAISVADKALSGGVSLTSSELLSKVAASTQGLNWFGKATNLVLETATFAGLEISEQTASTVAKEIFSSESELKQAIANNTVDEYLKEKIKNAPENMWNHFKEQGLNLLMLKAVSFAIGAHSANNLKGQYETLDNSNIYKTVIDGQTKVVVETVNGKMICNSTSDALSFLHHSMVVESMFKSAQNTKNEPMDTEYTDVTTENQGNSSGRELTLPIYSRSSLPSNTTVMSSTNLVISTITGEPIGRFLPPSSSFRANLGFTESQVSSLSNSDISLDAVRNQFYAATKPLSEPTVSLSDIKNVMDAELLPDITGNVNYDNAVNVRRQQIANRNFVISQLDTCRATNQEVFANNVDVIRSGIGEKQNIKALEEGVVINLYENGMISDVDVKSIFSQGSGLISRTDFDYFAKKKIPLTEFDNPEIIELRYINSTGQVLKVDSDYYREVKDKIVADEKPKIEKAKSEGKMIIVTGLPGAGKSTVVRNSLGEDVLDDYYSPDADAFKAEFSEYYLEGKGAGLVHKASTTVLKQEIMPLVLEEKKNIIYQTTGGEETLNKIIQQAKDNGYDVEIIHVNVAPERSMERALGRLHKEGRFLDPYVTLGISNEGRFNPNDIPEVMSNDTRVDRIRVYDTNGSKPTHIRDIEINTGANNGSSGVELETSPFKPISKPKQVTQAEVFKIPEVLTENELNLKSSDLVEVVGGKKVLTAQGEELVTKMAKQINKVAQEKEASVIQMVKNAGFADGAKFTYRSKSVSSLHDKIQNALFDNDNITLEETLDEVKDSEGVRTLFEENDYSSHPEVQELLAKGDREGAIRRAVELQSNSTYEALKRYIDSVADGTNEFEITRISNYMGKDGIPYFTEGQLSSIKAYADSKGVKIPIVERVTIKEEADGSRTETVNKKATTKVRGSGYTALQMNGRTKDGFVFESQNRAGKVDVFAEAEHVPYDLRTGKNIVGNHPELANIYAPMQQLLVGENKISDEMFDEHSAYLTAHYEYLRLTELGFEDGTNPPKFPRGLDARLRAENLELLHEYVEKIKAEPEREAELRAEYESKLVQNTPENTTDVRYNKVEPTTDATLAARQISIDEASQILSEQKNPDGTPRFSENSLKFVLKIMKNDVQLGMELLNMKEPDGDYRLEYFELNGVLSIVKENPTEIMQLLKMKGSDGNYRIESMFHLHEIYESMKNDMPTGKTLLGMKNPDGSNRFLSHNIPNLMKIKSENPEVFDYVINMKNPDGTYRFPSTSIEFMVNFLADDIALGKTILELKDADGNFLIQDYQVGVVKNTLNQFNDKEFAISLLKEVDSDGNHRFDTKSLNSMISYQDEAPQDFAKLMELLNTKTPEGKYKYSRDMVFKLYDEYKLANGDFEGLKSRFDVISDYMRANNLPTEYTVSELNTQEGGFEIRYSTNNVKGKIIFDAENNLVSTRALRHTSEGDEEILKVDETVSDMAVVYDSKVKDFKKMLSSLKEVRDKDGNLLYSEKYVESESVPGKYKIVRTDETGREWLIGNAEYSESGNLIIEKTITGSDNTVNDYFYAESPDGGRISYSRITDKDGNILLDNKQVYKKLGNNHFQSVENGISYDIQYTGKELIVTRSDGERVELKIGDSTASTYVHENIVPLLKQLPGSVLFDIVKFNLGEIGVGIHGIVSGNAQYSYIGNYVSLSHTRADNLEVFTLLHELGHMIDYKSAERISSNKELQEVFNSERSDFLEHQSEIESDAISYLINRRAGRGGLEEMVADTMALLFTNNKWGGIEQRGQYLQQYFPKTFAKIAELLGNASVDNEEIVLGDFPLDFFGTEPVSDEYTERLNQIEAPDYPEITEYHSVEEMNAILSETDIWNDSARLDNVLAEWKTDIDKLKNVRTGDEHKAVNRLLTDKYSLIENTLMEMMNSSEPGVAEKAMTLFGEKVMPLSMYYQSVASVIDNIPEVSSSYFNNSSGDDTLYGIMPLSNSASAETERSSNLDIALPDVNFDGATFRERLESYTMPRSSNARFTKEEIAELETLRKNHPEIDGLVDYQNGSPFQLRMDFIRNLVSFAETKPELYKVVIENFEKINSSSINILNLENVDINFFENLLSIKTHNKKGEEVQKYRGSAIIELLKINSKDSVLAQSIVERGKFTNDETFIIGTVEKINDESFAKANELINEKEVLEDGTVNYKLNSSQINMLMTVYEGDPLLSERLKAIIQDKSIDDKTKSEFQKKLLVILRETGIIKYNVTRGGSEYAHAIENLNHVKNPTSEADNLLLQVGVDANLVEARYSEKFGDKSFAKFSPETIALLNDFYKSKNDRAIVDYVDDLLKNSVEENYISSFLKLDETGRKATLADFAKEKNNLAKKHFYNQSDQAKKQAESNKIANTLVLMKMYNPESFDKLSRSKGFKMIKAGKLNVNVLSSVRAMDKVDDDYFYNLFEAKEQNFNEKVNSNPAFEEYDKDMLFKITDIEPSRQDEILKYIEKAKDSQLMKVMLEKIIIKDVNSMELDELNNVYQKPSDVQKRKESLINLIKITSQYPEKVKKVSTYNSNAQSLESLLSTDISSKLLNDKKDAVYALFNDAQMKYNNISSSDVEAALKFMEQYKDIDILKQLTSTQQDANYKTILGTITKNNIEIFKNVLNNSNGKVNIVQLSSIAVIKDYPEIKDFNGEAAAEIINTLDDVCANVKARILAQINDIKPDLQAKIAEIKSNTDLSTTERFKLLNKATSNANKSIRKLTNSLYVEITNRKGLVDIKLKDPAKYNKIKESGILDMVDSGEIDSSILRQLNVNSDLSPELYADLDAVKNGESIVAEFREGTTMPYAFSKTKIGDVIEIGNKMYLNDGNGLVEWNMTKEKYLELFPPVLRYATKQRRLGNCFFVSSLAKSMQNPLGRLDIYKSIELQGDDVVVKIKDYEEYGGTTTYKNGELDLDKKNMHIYGAKGLQMYEQTYARMALREEALDPTPNLSDETSSYTLMNRIYAGHMNTAMSEIHALENYGFKSEVPPDFTTGTISIVSVDEAKLDALLTKYFNNSNAMLGFGTKPKSNAASESEILSEYNLVSSHAYSIMGYNPTTRKVIINNPHSSAVNTEIPVDILGKYVSHIDITVL